MSPRPIEDPRDDAELLDAFVGGESGAFDALYFRHRDWVLRTARSFTGANDLALDVLQEVFAYLVERAPTLRLEARLTTFLYPAIRNLSSRARQKAARAEGDADPADIANLEDPKRDETLPLRDLRTLVDRLPPTQREVLLRVALDGSTLSEVAQAMEIPLGTVKSRLNQALKSLRADPATRRHFDRD